MTVSIVIPVYNAEQSIEECLGAVLAQSEADIEVICVNDGSTDASLNILHSYAQRDTRLRVITQPNRGVSAARNSGLAQATGVYVVFVDADDVVSTEMVRVYMRHFSQDVDLVLSETRGVTSAQTEAELKEFVYRGIRHRWLNPPWGKMYRRSVIEDRALRFHHGTSLGEDLLFNLQYMSHVRAVRVVEGSYYDQGVDRTSLTRSYRPTKYQELSIAHGLIREVIESQYGRTFSSLLNYIRIRSLISCVNSLYDPASPHTLTEARAISREMREGHKDLRVREGDKVMVALGAAYNVAGLLAISRLVRLYRRLERLGPTRRASFPAP